MPVVAPVIRAILLWRRRGWGCGVGGVGGDVVVDDEGAGDV